MTRQIDVDQILTIWLAEGGERAPGRHLLSALEQVGATSQRRPGWVGTRVSAMWSTMTQSPAGLIAATLAAIAIGLALTIGSGWIGDNDPSPSITPDEPSPVPSASDAPNSESFRSVTSLGTIEWTKVASEGPIHPWKVVGDEIFGMNVEDESLWTLSDALVWEPAAPPELGLEATFMGTGATEWAVVSPDGYGVMMGPASSRQVISREYADAGDEAIYRRTGAEWTEVDLPAFAPPPTAGLRILGPRFQGAAALGDSSWIVPAIYHIEVPWGDIFGQYPWNGEQVDPFPIWDEGSGQLRIVEPEAGNPFAGPALATLTVELAGGDPATIEFRDATTGDLVHAVSATLPGWTPEALLEALQGWGFEDVSFLVYRGEEITVVRPPWQMGEEWSDTMSIVTAFGRYFVAALPVERDFSASAIHLWESINGIEWAPVDVPEAAQEDVSWVELGGGDDALFVAVHAELGSDSIWSSTNGRQWTQADLVGSSGRPMVTEFGWWMQGTAAISADGSSWEVVEVPSLPGEPFLQYLGGLFFHGPGLEQGQNVIWIGRFAP